MEDIKFGISQLEKPAPLWYRRLTNAIILCFIPGAVGLVQGWPMSDAKRNIYMVIIAAIPFMLKGVGMLLGNGQQFLPTNEQMDNKK